MPPRNPSELARLEDELEFWENRVKTETNSFNRYEALTRSREIKKQLGYSK
jgi:hypothetical protein